MWQFKSSHHCVKLLSIIASATACISIAFIYLYHKGSVKNVNAAIHSSYSLPAEKLTDENCIPVCDSKSCIKQAYMILKSIKPSVDPCENFQKFLCGSYEEQFSSEEGHAVLLDMTQRITNALKNLLENIEAETESSAGKLKILYDSCVNKGSSELRGINDLRQILNEVEIFNWPYLATDFQFSSTGLPKLLATFRAYLEVLFIGFIMEPVGRNNGSGKHVKVDFNPHTFNDIPVIQKEDAADILEYFTLESEDVDALFTDLETVRKALINFAYDGKMYLDACDKNCSDVHVDCSKPTEDEWTFVCDMVQVYLNVTNLKQHVQTNEITIEKEYVFYVKNLIPRLKSLTDRTVANFFAFNLLWNHLSEINFFFRRKMQKYFKYFRNFEYENSVVSDKWRHCVAWIAINTKIMLENEFVKNYFKRSYIDEIHDIHQWHTSTISEMIDGQKWIYQNDQNFLKNHIKKLECNMAFNQRLLPNDTYLNRFYEAFNPEPESFLLNILSYRRNLLIALSLLNVNHFRKLETKYEASAFTNYEDEIAFYYGFLIPPAYYPGHKEYINRIQLAYIVSHEIGHSIYLKLNEISQFSDLTRNNFLKKKSCLNKQFSSFRFIRLNENLYGPRYLEENFADNLGYAVTDKMIEQLESSEEIFLLPGLPYSLKQLLYMSSRQAWCTKSSRKVELHFKRYDRHAPSEYRIIASGQNSKGYSEAFNCSEGSFMNPTKKCSSFDLN